MIQKVKSKKKKLIRKEILPDDFVDKLIALTDRENTWITFNKGVKKPLTIEIRCSETHPFNAYLFVNLLYNLYRNASNLEIVDYNLSRIEDIESGVDVRFDEKVPIEVNADSDFFKNGDTFIKTLKRAYFFSTLPPILRIYLKYIIKHPTEIISTNDDFIEWCFKHIKNLN